MVSSGKNAKYGLNSWHFRTQFMALGSCKSENDWAMFR